MEMNENTLKILFTNYTKGEYNEIVNNELSVNLPSLLGSLLPTIVPTKQKFFSFFFPMVLELIEKIEKWRSNKESTADFRCPISKKLMKQPVTLVKDGCIYDKESLDAYFKENNTIPNTNVEIEEKDKHYVPSHNTINNIKKYLEMYYSKIYTALEVHFVFFDIIQNEYNQFLKIKEEKGENDPEVQEKKAFIDQLIEYKKKLFVSVDAIFKHYEGFLPDKKIMEMEDKYFIQYLKDGSKKFNLLKKQFEAMIKEFVQTTETNKQLEDDDDDYFEFTDGEDEQERTKLSSEIQFERQQKIEQHLTSIVKFFTSKIQDFQISDSSEKVTNEIEELKGKMMERLVELAGSSTQILLDLANIYLQKKKTTEAFELIHQIMKHNKSIKFSTIMLWCSLVAKVNIFKTKKEIEEMFFDLDVLQKCVNREERISVLKEMKAVCPKSSKIQNALLDSFCLSKQDNNTRVEDILKTGITENEIIYFLLDFVSKIKQEKNPDVNNSANSDDEEFTLPAEDPLELREEIEGIKKKQENIKKITEVLSDHSRDTEGQFLNFEKKLKKLENTIQRMQRDNTKLTLEVEQLKRAGPKTKKKEMEKKIDNVDNNEYKMHFEELPQPKRKEEKEYPKHPKIKKTEIEHKQYTLDYSRPDAHEKKKKTTKPIYELEKEEKKRVTIDQKEDEFDDFSEYENENFMNEDDYYDDEGYNEEDININFGKKKEEEPAGFDLNDDHIQENLKKKENDFEDDDKIKTMYEADLGFQKYEKKKEPQKNKGSYQNNSNNRGSYQKKNYNNRKPYENKWNKWESKEERKRRRQEERARLPKQVNDIYIDKEELPNPNEKKLESFSKLFLPQLRVLNLDHEVTEDQIKNFFSEQTNPNAVTKVEILDDFVIVHFQRYDDVLENLKVDGYCINGIPVDIYPVLKPKNRKESRHFIQISDEDNYLFEMSQLSIKEFFGEHGIICSFAYDEKHLRIIIQYAHKSEMLEAIKQKNGKALEQVYLKVEQFIPPQIKK